LAVPRTRERRQARELAAQGKVTVQDTAGTRRQQEASPSLLASRELLHLYYLSGYS